MDVYLPEGGLPQDKKKTPTKIFESLFGIFLYILKLGPSSSNSRRHSRALVPRDENYGVVSRPHYDLDNSKDQGTLKYLQRMVSVWYF